jgi:hypothetical protein
VTGPIPAAGNGGMPDPHGVPRPSYDTRQSYDPRESYGMPAYGGEPQWDSGMQPTDPNLRYRDPGPGMPGYGYRGGDEL